MYDVKVTKGKNYKLTTIFFNVQRKSYIKAKDKCQIGKNICSRYNKEYTYSFNI